MADMLLDFCIINDDYGQEVILYWMMLVRMILLIELIYYFFIINVMYNIVNNILYTYVILVI